MYIKAIVNRCLSNLFLKHPIYIAQLCNLILSHFCIFKEVFPDVSMLIFFEIFYSPNKKFDTLVAKERNWWQPLLKNCLHILKDYLCISTSSQVFKLNKTRLFLLFTCFLFVIVFFGHLLYHPLFLLDLLSLFQHNYCSSPSPWHSFIQNQHLKSSNINYFSMTSGNNKDDPNICCFKKIVQAPGCLE